MSLFPAALGWQRPSQVGLSEFEASLVYNRASSRRARATQRDPVLKKQTKQTNKQKTLFDKESWAKMPAPICVDPPRGIINL